MTSSGPAEVELRGTTLVPGSAEGELLVLGEPISFWGGIDPASGTIVDVHHPQAGQCIRGRMLALPGTRGSTAGPGALLETVIAGNGPAGILLTQPDLVCVVAMAALESLGMTAPPVFMVDAADVAALGATGRCRLDGGRAWVSAERSRR
jgi:predicted aconitase with swiveling domain